MVAEKWYLADPAMLPKRPNSKIELEIKREIQAIKLLFGKNGSVAKFTKWQYQK
ncbi:MAG: hypothetical protein PVG39_29685 [Desulfobacteraceae bacterium]